MNENHETPYVTGLEDMKRRLKDLATRKGPTFFKLWARLPKQGRTDTIVAASDTMSVVLKTYAKSGENGLHRHVNEDHVFVVLQGRARFFGPEGETKEVGMHDGVLLPSSAYYWFQSVGDEALVMLRVGAKTSPDADPFLRVNGSDEPEHGYTKENKQVELILDEKAYFGTQS